MKIPIEFIEFMYLAIHDPDNNHFLTLIRNGGGVVLDGGDLAKNTTHNTAVERYMNDTVFYNSVRVAYALATLGEKSEMTVNDGKPQ